MSKELIAATRQEIESWPDTALVDEVQGKHRKLILSYKGETRFVVISSTPSDRRALANHIATVRRELRGMGASKHQPAPKPFKQFVPATQPLIIEKEVIMKQANKIEAIFTSIGELRYGEMILLAELLASVASDMNLRRSQTNDWAKMLHSIAESAVTPSPTKEAAL
jgi:hypothetical protein